MLLSVRQDEIREANAALPERQREVLVLRELEDLSYDEIAEIMAMNRNSVAQLISRAPINLRDALRGTALASIAASTADCERALPLLAARQDGKGQRDEGWLDEHLLACHTCGLSREAMEEAGVSYRAWLPVAAAPVLFRETLASAAEAVGADWSDLAARQEAANGGLHARLKGAAGAGGSPPDGAHASIRRHRKRNLALIGGVAALLLLVLFVTGLRDGTPVANPVPAADEAAPATAAEPDETAPEPKTASKPKKPKQDSGEPKAAPAAAPEKPVAEEDAEPAPTEGSAAPPARPRQERGRNDAARKQGGGGGDNLVGEEPGREPPRDTPPDPPVSDPPADPPSDPPITEDPPPPPADPGCRDAAGNPIRCPPPPSPCIPGQTCPRVPGTTPPPRGPR